MTGSIRPPSLTGSMYLIRLEVGSTLSSSSIMRQWWHEASDRMRRSLKRPVTS